MSEAEDPNLAIIKARKLKELQKIAAKKEKLKSNNQKINLPTMNKEIISRYLYDRGDEVLALAESQFPIQTKAIVDKIAEIIRSGEVSQKISGGELLSFFRSVGLNIRINTNIRIEDHGKLVSFSDKLKYENEDNSVKT
jgi:DNA-binding TFAR19-related protein (PDSD5 family)